MSANRYLPAARSVAQAFPGILVEMGLHPTINRFVLTESERGDAWLFVVLDDSVFELIKAYANPNALAQLSLLLQGHPVLFSNSFGLRYAVLLNPPRTAAANI